MMKTLKNTKLDRFPGYLAEVIKVSEVPPCWQWAEEERVMPTEVTAVPGPYRISTTPHMKEIQESFDDPDVQITVMCLASRIGKTEAELNVMGRTVDRDPANVIVCYPSIEAVKTFFRESVQPMIRSSRVLRRKVASETRRDGKNTTLRKKFPGGQIRGIGANVPSAFRGVQARIVIGDEIDAMEMGKEGDPIDLLLKRSENYPNAIQILSSTPTVAGVSRIWEWLEKSDFRKWFVPSPFGDHWHVLDWANVQWDEGNPESARYVDPVTGDEWTDDQRRECVMAGEWRATQEFTGVRGFWADGLVSLFPSKKGFKNKLHQFASEFLQAKHNGPDAMQVWHNTFRALPWEDEAEKVEWELVAQRAEDYETKPLPDRVLMLTIAADVQDDRIEFEWVGWSDDFESWGIYYGVIVGDTKRQHVWDKLGAEVRRKWDHPTMKPLGVARGFVDEGYRTDMTRKFCVEMLAQGIDLYPCKGIGRTGVMEPELLTFKLNRKQKGRKAPTYNVGTTVAKRTIYAHLLADGPGPNTMHFPNGNGYDDRYFQMLTVERVMTRYSFGKAYKVFEAPNGSRNEALDIRVYGYAAAVSLNPSWDAIRENNRKPRIDVEPISKDQLQNDLTESKPASNDRRRESRRRSGAGTSFVNDY